MNPNAVVFWGFGSVVGYLIGGDLRSTLIGLGVALGISLLAAFIPDRPRYRGY